MRKGLILFAALLAGCASRYGVVAKTDGITGHLEPRAGAVCMLAGSLSGIDVREIGTIKAGKRSYGGTDEIMRAMADEARRVTATPVGDEARPSPERWGADRSATRARVALVVFPSGGRRRRVGET